MTIEIEQLFYEHSLWTESAKPARLNSLTLYMCKSFDILVICDQQFVTEHVCTTDISLDEELCAAKMTNNICDSLMSMT